MPPTPISGSAPRVSRYISARSRVEGWNRGAPESPPGSGASGLLSSAGRAIVVLKTIKPVDRRVEGATSAISSCSRRVRSGAILTSKGGRLPASLSRSVGDCADQHRDLAAPLQIAQTRRVRRGDVDHQIIGIGAEGDDTAAVIGRSIGAVAAAAQIGAEHATPLPAHQPSRHGIEALVVEAHPVDHRLVLGQAEQPWLRIAWLRARAISRADLDQAEAPAQHGVRYLGILVEAGSEPDRIREGEIPEPHGQDRIVRHGLAGTRLRGQAADGQLMRPLRRQPKRSRGRAKEGKGRGRHHWRSGDTLLPSGPSGSGLLRARRWPAARRRRGKSWLAARRLPFECRAERRRIDRQQHQPVLAGAVARRTFDDLRPGREMDEAVGAVLRGSLYRRRWPLLSPLVAAALAIDQAGSHGTAEPAPTALGAQPAGRRGRRQWIIPTRAAIAGRRGGNAGSGRHHRRPDRRG